jgi:SseB protein N-terminal domain
VQEGFNIHVNTPNNAKGIRVLPAFTDAEALANYDPNSPHIALPATEIYKIAVQLRVGEVVVNAFDPVRKPIRSGGTVTRREFEALAQGMIPEPTLDGKGQILTARMPIQVQIGSCRIPMNPDAKSRLQAEASQFLELSKVYRYQMRYVEIGTQSEVFGLVCYAQGARFQQIVTTLMSAIQPFLAQDQYVDFTQLRSEQMPLIEKHGETIYEK